MPSVPQAPANITIISKERQEVFSLKVDGEGEDKEITVRIDVSLDGALETALKALIMVLEPENGSNTMMAIDCLVEEAFLAGVKFTEELKAETIRESIPSFK